MLSNDYGDNGLNDFSASVNVDDVVKALKAQLEDSLLNNPVSVAGIDVTLSKSITGQGGHRYWFVCPNCRSRVAKLFIEQPVVGCRHCLQIKYASSRYKGMVENEITEGRQD